MHVQLNRAEIRAVTNALILTFITTDPQNTHTSASIRYTIGCKEILFVAAYYQMGQGWEERKCLYLCRSHFPAFLISRLSIKMWKWLHLYLQPAKKPIFVVVLLNGWSLQKLRNNNLMVVLNSRSGWTCLGKKAKW